jgi:DNA polymerase-3 subunit alpha
MNALCFTEHGSIFEWIHKKEAIESAGMKYIHGIEAYITETIETKIRDNYHCILIARNYDGVKELNQLSSKSFNRKDGHFYYVPRITIDELINTSKNIIISTACLGGILHNGNDIIKDKFITFLANNKDRCFLEIQHHIDVDGEQISYNKYLYELSKSIDVRLVTGTDTHALNDEHMDGRSILQKAKGVNFANEGSWDLTFKSYDELIMAYEKQKSLPMDVIINAINNTNAIADMVEHFVLDKTYKYPHLWENSEKTFQQKIMQGLKDRGVDKYTNYQEYVDRIKYELKAYRHNGAIDFMLLMSDIIDWCNDNDVKVGYGRGSVNGSIIAWLFGITEMDSIKHKLYFDRFLNVERVSLSDIDTDFPPSRIDDVKKYIFSKTGLYCCDIVTFNTVALKGAIRDIGRAMQIPLEEVGVICDEVEFKEEELRVKYKTLFKYVDLISGTIVSVGSHPCGMVTSPHEVEDTIGTFSTSTSEYPISQINMKEIDGLNYVKLDLLRLDTIELINETCKLANIERLTPDNVDITDVKVWQSIRDDTTQIFQWEGNTGNDYIKKLLSDDNIKKFQEVNEDVDRMTLLSIGNSAIRPAGASYRDDLGSGVVRKIGNVAIDEFLSTTFGYLVFQEQIIEFLHSYCGYTMGEADVVRRGFAKKTGTEQHIPRIKEGFTKIMTETYGYSAEKAEADILAFVQVITDASSYLFSLNHSQPYSFEGYVSGWLRYYYPLEFLTVALNINKDKEDKTNGLTAYAKKVGIKIKPPRFRRSKSTYFCDKNDNSIYKGIGSIKFMNNQIADELYELREKQYADFLDVLIDIKGCTHVNSRQLTILVEIEFFEEFGDINELLHYIKIYDDLSSKSQIKKDSIESLGVTEKEVRIFSGNETETRIEEIDCEKFIESLGYIGEQVAEQLSDCIKYKYISNDGEEKEKLPNGYSSTKVIKKYEIKEEQKKQFATKIVIGKFYDINTNELIRYIVKNTDIKTCSLPQKIRYQLEHLGYIDYIDDSYEWRYVVVTKLNTQYSPKFMAYSINNGKTVEMKVSKKRDGRDKSQIVSFNDVSFQDGDVLYVRDVVKKQRTKKTEDGFVPVPDVYDWWIKDYVKLGDEDVRKI